MSLLLIVFALLSTIISNANPDLIDGIWLDDFKYDSDGIIGWDDNNIINGTTKYHGWYGKDDDDPPSLSRSFQCKQPSDIQLSFIIYFGCNIEGSESLTVSLNDEQTNIYQYSNLNLYDVNEPLASEQCTAEPTIGFKASNVTTIISATPIRELTTFIIEFEFILSAGVGNEFEGISDIKIECIPASLARELLLLLLYPSYIIKAYLIHILISMYTLTLNSYAGTNLLSHSGSNILSNINTYDRTNKTNNSSSTIYKV